MHYNIQQHNKVLSGLAYSSCCTRARLREGSLSVPWAKRPPAGAAPPLLAAGALPMAAALAGGGSSRERPGSARAAGPTLRRADTGITTLPLVGHCALREFTMLAWYSQ
jgi:hypothetical protein